MQCKQRAVRFSLGRAGLLGLALLAVAGAGRAAETGVWSGKAERGKIVITLTEKNGRLTGRVDLPDDHVTLKRGAVEVNGNRYTVKGQADMTPDGLVQAPLIVSGTLAGEVWRGEVVYADDYGNALVTVQFEARRGGAAEPVPGRKATAGAPPAVPGGQPSATPPPPAGAAAYGDLSGERAVWLKDYGLGMNFAMVVVRDGWTVEGNVAWNCVYRANPATVNLTFTNPRERLSLGLAIPVGAFTWSEGKAAFGIEGAFMVDNGIFNLRYRNAAAMLKEFFGPFFLKLRNNSVIAGIKDDPDLAAALRAKTENLANDLRRTGTPVTGWETSAATMTVDYTAADGTAMVDLVTAQVTAVANSRLDGSVDWNLETLVVLSFPKASMGKLQAIQEDCRDIRMNLQWAARKEALAAELRAGGVAFSRQSQRELSARIQATTDRMHNLHEKFRRALMQESVYADPGGNAYVVPNTGKYGVIDSLTKNIVLSEAPLNPGSFGPSVDELRLIER